MDQGRPDIDRERALALHRVVVYVIQHLDDGPVRPDVPSVHASRLSEPLFSHPPLSGTKKSHQAKAWSHPTRSLLISRAPSGSQKSSCTKANQENVSNLSFPFASQPQELHRCDRRAVNKSHIIPSPGITSCRKPRHPPTRCEPRHRLLTRVVLVLLLQIGHFMSMFF